MKEERNNKNRESNDFPSKSHKYSDSNLLYEIKDVVGNFSV